MCYIPTVKSTTNSRSAAYGRWVFALALVAGCGGDDDDDGGKPPHDGQVAGQGGAGSGAAGSAGNAGSGGGGSNAGRGGAGASGSSGRGGSAAGSGGSGAGSGGSSGAAGSASIDDVDLTLGGFNQDLPAPGSNCLMRDDFIVGCIALAGEYNGEAFDLVCSGADFDHTYGARYTFGCRTEALGSELQVELIVSQDFVEKRPATFSADTATAAAYIRFWNTERSFETYRDRLFTMFGHDATHDQQMRVAGISENVQQSSPGGQPSDEWRIGAVFALSLTPKSGCAKDAMGLGCDEVELRANLRAFPVER
jgi:hypothetical protein